MRRDPVFWVSAVALGIILLAAVFAERLAPYGPNEQDILKRLQPPGIPGHVLGTDEVGRDILSRLIHGARISLLIGVIAVGLSCPLGVLVGLVAGYVGRRTDDVLMHVTDIQLAIPTILLAIAVVAVLGPGLPNVIITLSVTGWTLYARLVRGQTMTVKTQDYVQAARANGAGDTRILLRHVLPNVFSPVIVVAVFAVANMIVLEATLSFLGLGVEPSVVTWGRMLNGGRLYLNTAWWLTAFPGLAIFVTVLAVNLLGDHLRDWLDPRLRGLARLRRLAHPAGRPLSGRRSPRPIWVWDRAPGPTVAILREGPGHAAFPLVGASDWVSADTPYRWDIRDKRRNRHDREDTADAGGGCSHVQPLIHTGTLMAQETITPLLSSDLADISGKESLMYTVEFPPGFSSPVHRHNAHVSLYVLEGSVVMQVKGRGANHPDARPELF